MPSVDDRAIAAAEALERSRIRGSIPLAIALREGIGTVDEAVSNLSRDGLILSVEDRMACDLVLEVLRPFVSSAPAEGADHAG